MSAFRQSVEAMIPALRRYARALARDADIADDLVQDTLVRALRSERLFLGGDVRSWLYTILTNLNKNRRRSLARRPQFMPLLENNPDASGTEAEGRDIARALATLVEEQRAVLLLVMLEGLSSREVAGIQGVPIGTVMSRLARARARVRASLAGAAAGWVAHGARAAPSLFQNITDDALDAHKLYVVEVRHPVEVPGDEKTHLQQWLTRRCGRSVNAPELEAAGLKLVGGRLLPGPSGPASFLMYEGPSGERFTIYAAKATTDETQMRYTTEGSTGALFWADRG